MILRLFWSILPPSLDHNILMLCLSDSSRPISLALNGLCVAEGLMLCPPGAGRNNIRRHSVLSFPILVDYRRGDPQCLLAKRRRRLQGTRETRKQENVKLRKRMFPWTETPTVA